MRSWVTCVIALAAGCYAPPHPECGFICGPQASCPTGFTCVASDNRCHRAGTDTLCEGLQDAFDADAVPDGHDRPVVQARTPAPGATGVLVITSVTVSFSEGVLGISPSTFRLTDAGSVIAANVYSPGGIGVLTPVRQLAGDRTYDVWLSSGIRDAAGLPLIDDHWTFTTGPDTIGPRVQTTSPAQGAVVTTDTTIVVELDEPVFNVDASSFTVAAGPNPGTTPIPGSVSVSGDGSLVLFTPSAALPSATTINVTLLTTITDASGNPLTSPWYFNFSTQ